MIIIFTTLSLISFVAGIILASFVFFPTLVLFTLWSFFSFYYGVVRLFSFRSSILSSGLTLLCISSLCLGILRYEYAVERWDLDVPHDWYGTEVSVDAVVTSSVRTERSQVLMVETKRGRGLITTQPHPTFLYGDMIAISGGVDSPLEQLRPPAFLWSRGISFTMAFPGITLHGRPRHHYSIAGTLLSIRDAFENRVKLLYPEPYNALADGMLFGSTNGIDQHIYDAFRKSGTSHILVLSGFNISVVATFLLLTLGLVLRRRVAVVGAMVGVVLFTIMTGSGAPAVRAACMVLVALLGHYAGRQYRADVALLWAVFLMLLWNPLLLRWDAGFDLSVAATVGMIYITPRLVSVFRGILIPEFFGTLVASTIGAQAAVLPFFVWWGVSVSWWSVPANILIVPLVPLIMATSFFAATCAFIFPQGALLLAFPGYLLMKWQIWIALYFGS